MSEMKRKAVLLSVYYTGEEPIFTSDDDFFLNDAATTALQTANKHTRIIDVALDRTPDRLFNFNSPLAQYIYRAFRRWK
jgi:hypothetical protein